MGAAQIQRRSRWQRRPAQLAIVIILAIVLVMILAVVVERAPMIVIGAFAVVLIGIFLVLPRDWRRFAFLLWWIAGLTLVVESQVFAMLTPADALSLDLPRRFTVENPWLRHLLSTIVGLLFVLAVPGLPLYLLTAFSTQWILSLRQAYGLSYWPAFRLIGSFIIGVNPPITIVDEGQIKEAKPKGVLPFLGGPALVIIRPYNAVVFEQAGRVTRIEGPGEVRMSVEERIKAVVDLRLQGRPFQDAPMLTRDRVPLKVTGGVGFRIEKVADILADAERATTQFKRTLETETFFAAGPESRQGQRDDTRIHRSSVYKAAYNPRAGQTWIEQIQGDVESEARKVIRLYDFRDIYNLDPRNPGVNTTVIEEISDAIKESLKKSAVRFGIQVLGVSIKSIRIDEMDSIQWAYFAALGAEWRERIAMSQVEVEGRAFKHRTVLQQQALDNLSTILQQFRDVLTQMSQSGIKLSAEVVDRYLQVTEHLLTNIVTDHSTARRYLDTMETLARVSPSTIIAAGMDVSNLTDFLLPGSKPHPPQEDKNKPVP